jgi:hypothetical protein
MRFHTVAPKGAIMDDLFLYFLIEFAGQVFGRLWPKRKEKPLVAGRPSVPLVPPPGGSVRTSEGRNARPNPV